MASFGQDSTTGEPLDLPEHSRTRHVSIIGRTGYGKTTLLEQLIMADLRDYTSAIVIDPHGDLSQRIISLANPEERERITLLEVWPDAPFRLNLLECSDPSQLDRTVSDILTLFNRLFDSGDAVIGHRLQRYLGNALRTLIPNGGTLADVERLFYDNAYRADMLRSVRNRKVHQFWLSYEQIPLKERFNQLESTINRLDELLSAETAYAMVSTQDTTVPLTNVLNQDGELLLIRIPVGELGDQYARFYGSLSLSLLTDRLFARAELPEEARHRLHLYLDEYGWFATPTTAALLQQARKYNLGATIAFQTLADLPDEKNRQAALQVGTFIVLRLTGQNADELVSAFPVIPTRETISESIGFRKITSFTPTPVSHLLNTPHSNAQANKAAEAFLRPLQDLAEGRVRRELNLEKPHLKAPPSKEYLQETIRIINTFLVTVMKQGQDITNDAIASAATDVVIKLCLIGYYPFPAEACGVMERSQLFKSQLTEWLKQAALAVHPLDYIIRAKTSPWQLPITLQHQWLTENTDSYVNDPSWTSEHWRQHYGKQALERLKETKKTYAADVLQAAVPLQTDAIHLISLCKILAVEPILVPTGQEKEEFRDRTHLQTHADARIQLAGILANLREYTAYYQIGSQHGQVELAAPLQPAGLDEEAIKEVRERSKSLYGVPIEPPEEDTPPDLSSSPPSSPRGPGPRIGRRSPRADS